VVAATTGVAALVAGFGYWQGWHLSEPRRSWEAMRRAACSSDADAFFAKIDESQVFEGLREQGMEKARREANDMKLQGLAREVGLAAAQRAVAAMNPDDVFDDYRSDMKKGADGNICRMSFVDATGDGSTGRVDFRTPSGNAKFWRFHRYDSGWLVVEIGNR
jgi:hypothetical protein